MATVSIVYLPIGVYFPVMLSLPRPIPASLRHWSVISLKWRSLCVWCHNLSFSTMVPPGPMSMKGENTQRFMRQRFIMLTLIFLSCFHSACCGATLPLHYPIHHP